MKNDSGERFWLFLVPCWGLSTVFLVVFLINSGVPPKTPTAIYDLTYLIASLVLLLLPFVSRVRLGKLLEFERELDKTREDVKDFRNETRQMFFLLSSNSANANVNIYPPLEGTTRGREQDLAHKGSVAIMFEGPCEEAGVIEHEPTGKARTAMEYKILNTLWNKQIGKFPDLDVFFTFRLNASAPEFLAFREAGNRLLVEGLIGETNVGQFHLTQTGLRYCAKNYKAIPVDMWGQYEPSYQDNLAGVLAKLRE